MNAKQLFTTGLLTSTVVLGLGSIAPAEAGTLYEFEYDRTEGTQGQPIWINNSNGIYEEISVSYNDGTQTLNWSSLFTKQGDDFIDGGWLVISDGPNPKSHDLEYSIFYLDGQQRTLSAFAYNGQNNSSSWNANPFLQSWTDALEYTTNGDQSELSFSIDVSGINSRTDLGDMWKGSAFGDEVGLWFHAGQNTSVEYTYNEDGSISGIDSFSTEARWFETNALATTKTEVPDPTSVPIPEPSTLFGLGLLATAGVLRRRQSC